MKKKAVPRTPAFEYLYTVDWDEECNTNPSLVHARIRSIGKSGDVFIEGRPYRGFRCKARISAVAIGNDEARYFFDPAEAWVHFIDQQRNEHRLDVQRATRRERILTMTPPPVEDAAD